MLVTFFVWTTRETRVFAKPPLPIGLSAIALDDHLVLVPAICNAEFFGKVFACHPHRYNFNSDQKTYSEVRKWLISCWGGNVVERNVTSPRSPARLPTSGFPAVQHRSKSAFARGRSDQSKAKPNEVPLVVSTADTATKSKIYSSIPGGDETEGSQVDWRHEMSEENDRVVQSMTEDELEEAKREILERFGSDLLKRMTHARAGKTGQKSVRYLGELNEGALVHKAHRNTY